MKILHVASLTTRSTHGVANAVTTLAAAEASLGHTVGIYSPRAVLTEGDHVWAKERSLTLWGATTPGAERGVISEFEPDICHFAFLFQPAHLRVARELAERGIPYVVSPHGALQPGEFTRGALRAARKRLYFAAVERHLVERAALVRCVSAREATTWSGKFPSVATSVIPNGVSPPSSSGGHRPSSDTNRVRLGFLGRLEPWNKGLDLLLRLPQVLHSFGWDATVALAGKPPDRDLKSFDRLMRSAPGARFCELAGVVHGESKAEFLRSLNLYVQMSRWEVFGISMVEAMLERIPVVMSRVCDLAEPALRAGAAVAVPLDSLAAGLQIAEILGDDAEPSRIARRAHLWAVAEFSPQSVATKMTTAYAEVA